MSSGDSKLFHIDQSKTVYLQRDMGFKNVQGGQVVSKGPCVPLRAKSRRMETPNRTGLKIEIALEAKNESNLGGVS
jgi:hypothetical protein